MKPKILTDGVFRFYEGRAFNKEAKSCGDEDKMLDYCLRKAWQDAISRERFAGKGNSVILQNANQIKRKLKTELTEELDRINNDFSFWHRNMCEDNAFGMRCGVWQKFINMAFKYMYCAYQKKEIFQQYDAVFEKCHCPVDSIIAKKVYAQLAKTDSRYELVKLVACNGNINWNNMTYEQYLVIQSVIGSLAKKENLTPLEYDFAHWDE